MSRFRWRDRRPLLIPMPTSKCRTDETYDDRIVQVVQKISDQSGIEWLEAFDLKATVRPSHSGGSRSLASLRDNTILLDNAWQGLSDFDVAVLVDDVLTTGVHFAVCKRMLKEVAPHLIVIGVFWTKQLPSEYEYAVVTF